MKLIKWILRGVLALVVLVVVGAAVALSMLDMQTLKDKAIVAAEAATGRNVKIGDVKIKWSLVPSIAVSGIELANAEWAGPAPMVKAGQASVTLKIMPLFSGHVEIDRVTLSDAQINLIAAQGNKANWSFTPTAKNAPAPEAKKTESSAAGAFSIGQLVLTNTELNYRDAAGKTTKLDIGSLRAETSGFMGGLDVDGTLSVNNLPIELAAKIDNLAKLIEGTTPTKATINLKLAGGSIDFDGQLPAHVKKDGLKGQLKITSLNINQLATTYGMAAGLPSPLDLDTTITQHATRYDLKPFALGLAGQRVTGNLSVVNDAKPSISGDIAAPKLDLTAFGAAPQTGFDFGLIRAAYAATRLFSTAPLPFSTLGSANADIAFKFTQLILPGLNLENVDGQAKLIGGQLSLPLTASLGGTAFKLNLGASSSGAVAVNAKADKADLMRLLPALGMKPMHGIGDLAVDVRGGGQSMAAIAGSLNGVTRLIVTDAKLSNEWRAYLDNPVVQNVASWLPRGDNIALNCVVSRFDFRGGVGQAQTLYIDAPDFSVRGAGSINLGSESLNLALRPIPRDKSKLQLTLPFNVTGAMTNPTATPDARSIASGVAGAALAGATGPAGLLVGAFLPSSASARAQENGACPAFINAALTGAAPELKQSEVAKPAPQPEQAPQQNGKPEKPIKQFKNDLKGLLKGLGQ